MDPEVQAELQAIEQQYDPAVATATDRVDSLVAAYNVQLQRIAAEEAKGDQGDPLKLEAERKHADASFKALQDARQDLSTVQRQRADAYRQAASKAKTPAEKQAIEAKSKAETDEATARARLYDAQAQQASAKTDIERTAADASLKSAQAALDNAATNRKEADAKIKHIAEQTRETGAKADIAEAEADVAPRAAEAAVQGLEAGVGKTQADTARIEADTAKTQAETQKGQLDRFYGVPERIAAIRKMFEDGLLGDGDAALNHANQMVDEVIAQARTGKSVYEMQREDQDATKARLDQQVTQRGQDADLAQTKTTTMGSYAGTALGHVAEMNKTAKVGSSLGADAYLAMLNSMQGRLAQSPFNAPPPVAFPEVPALAQQYMQRQAAPPVPQPQQPALGSNAAGNTAKLTLEFPAGGSSGKGDVAAAMPTIPLLMGQTPPTSPIPQASPMQQAVDQAGLPAMVEGKMPPSTDFVNQLYGRGPYANQLSDVTSARGF